MNSKTKVKSIDNLESYRQFISSRAIIEFDRIDSLDSKIKGFHESVVSQFPAGPEKISEEDKYMLRSKSSRLVLLTDKLVWEVGYFGNYVQDYDLCHCYLSEKLFTAFKGIKSELMKPIRFLALITNAQISCNGLEVQPVHFLENHFLALREGQGPYADMSLRVGLERDNKYFINFEVAAYWLRGLEQMGILPEKRIVRLHELQVLDNGIKLVVDVNTKRDAFDRLPDYKEQDLQKFLNVGNEAVSDGLSKFLRKEL
ncbi:MAG: hypothetical protein ACE5HI_11405 [bacterium]